MTRRSIIALLCVAVLAAGCALGGRKDKTEEPSELVAIDGAVRVNKLWSTKVGGDAERLRLGLRPASDGTRVFAAAHNGDVSGFDLLTGQRDWRTETGLPLSAGPGYGEGLVVVASAEGDVVALESVDGVRRWTTRVRGEVLAAPVIGRGTVVVRTVSGQLLALDASNGEQRWSYEQGVPRLSLRGNSQPALGEDRVIAGFDNGRLVAIRLADGVELWQAPLASQRGRTELERLADIDSNVVVIGQEIYAAGFQSRAALVVLADGGAVWTEELSSVGGLAIDWTSLYATAGNGVVTALDRATGARQWQQDALLRRGVTGPEAFGEAVVVGDFEGYLHWLSSRDGTLVTRARAGKAMIAARPLAVGERLLVQDESGSLHAFALPRSARQ